MKFTKSFGFQIAQYFWRKKL